MWIGKKILECEYKLEKIEMVDNQNSRKKIIAIILYILIIIVDIIWAISLNGDFISTYGDKSFSKGIIGILLCNCGNIIVFIGASVGLGLYLINSKKV